MAYSVFLSNNACSRLKEEDNFTAGQIVQKLSQTAENPSSFFARVAGREDYLLAFGEWRIVAHILHNKNSVFIISMENAEKVYEK
ncbi:MAG: hypothetical protein ABIH83_05895 [Candidatus Micrarchaeota archaeon]